MSAYVIVVFVLMAAFVVILWQIEKKRREEVLVFARAGGWKFRPRKRRGRSLPFSPFGQGHSRYSRDHMFKTVPDAVPGLGEAEIELFEYHYAVTSGSGKSRSTTHYHYTCALVESGVLMGRVRLRKEHFGDKIVQAIGFDDIDFEDHEFSKRFMVKARDRRDAYDLLDRRMMDFLLANPGWSVETDGPLLFVFDRGKPRAEKCAALERFVLGFLATLPRPLVNRTRVERGLPPAVDAGNVARHHGRERGT